MTPALPGSHLAEAPCQGCGRAVYAIPSRVASARCADCGREETGAQVTQLPPPPAWFTAHNPPPAPHPTRWGSITLGAHIPTLPLGAGGPGLYAACIPCRTEWRLSPNPDLDGGDVLTRQAGAVHHHVHHNPHGWASGVPGGHTDRPRRTRRPR